MASARAVSATAVADLASEAPTAAVWAVGGGGAGAVPKVRGAEWEGDGGGEAGGGRAMPAEGARASAGAGTAAVAAARAAAARSVVARVAAREAAAAAAAERADDGHM